MFVVLLLAASETAIASSLYSALLLVERTDNQSY